MASKAQIGNCQTFPVLTGQNLRDMGARSVCNYLANRQLRSFSSDIVLCVNCHSLYSYRLFDEHNCSFEYEFDGFSESSISSSLVNNCTPVTQEFSDCSQSVFLSDFSECEYFSDVIFCFDSDNFLISGFDFSFDLFFSDYSLSSFFDLNFVSVQDVVWYPQSGSGKDYSPCRNRLNDLAINLSTHEKLIRQERSLRTKGVKFHRKLKHHKDVDLTMIYAQDNVRLLQAKRAICICELNRAFSRFEFKPFSRLTPNDSMIDSIARSCDLTRKIKLGLHVLNDRITLERVLNHCEMLYLESLLRCDTPNTVFFFQTIVLEMSFIRDLPVSSFVHVCACERSVNLKCRMEFVPQSFIPSLEIGQESLDSLEDVVSTFSKSILDASKNLSNTSIGIDISDSSQMFLSELVNSTLRTFKTMARQGVSHSVSHTVDSGLFSGVGDFLLTVKPILPILAIALVGSLVVLKKISCLQGVGLLSIVGSIYFDSVKEKVVSLYSCFFEYFKPQSAVDNIESLFTLFTCHNFGATLCSDGLFAAFKKHSRYSQMKMSSTNLISDILVILQKIVNFFTDFFEKERYVFFSGKNPELCSFLEDASSFIKDRETNPTIDNESGIALGQLEKRANDLSSLLSEQSDRQKLNFCIQNLKPWIDKKRSGFWYGAGPRVEPLCLCIEGESQIGKSHLMQALIVSVSAMLFEGKKLERFRANKNSEIYGYNWNRKHQDGYVGQTHVVLDDFGELRDVVGSEKNPYAEMVHMINTVAYHMEMAELQNKADSFFKSEFVWMTTNNTKWDIQSMNHPEAFINRIHYAFHCRVKDEYKDKDVKQDTKIYERWEHTEIWLIRYLPYKKFEFVRKIGGFYDLRDFIISAYKKHYAKGELMMDIHDSLVDEAMKVRGIVPQIYMGQTSVPIFMGRVFLASLLKVAIPFASWLGLNTRKGQGYIAESFVAINSYVEEKWFPTCSYSQYNGNMYEYTTWAQLVSNKVRCGGCSACDPFSTYLHCFSEDLLKYPLFVGMNPSVTKMNHVFVMIAVSFRNGVPIEEIYRDFYNESVSLESCKEEVDHAVSVLDEFDLILERYDDRVDLPYPCFENVAYFEWCSERTDRWLAMAIYIALIRVRNTVVPEHEPNFSARFKKKFNENAPFFYQAGVMIKKMVPLLSIMIVVYGSTYAAMKAIDFFIVPGTDSVNKELVSNSDANRALNSKCYFEDNCIIVDIELGDGYRLEAHYPFDKKPDLDNFKYLWINKQGGLDLEITEDENSFIVLRNNKDSPDVFVNGLESVNVHYDLERNWLCIDDIFVRDSEKVLKQNVLTEGHPFYKYLSLVKEYVPQSRIINESKILEICRSPFRPQTCFPNSVVPVAQFVYDQAEEEIARKVNLRNEILFYLPRNGEACDPLIYTKHKQNFSAIMLGGLVGIMNGHSQSAIYDLLDRGVIAIERPIVVVRANDPHRVPIFWTPSRDDFRCYEGFGSGDAVGFKLPSDVFENFPNIVKYFVERKRMKSSINFPGTLWTVSHGPIIRSVGVSISTTTYGTTDYNGYSNGNCWMYSHPTVEGDCGSMLTMTDVKSGSSKIIGIHCAGNGTTHGLSFPIFREDVYNIKKAFDDNSDDSIIEEMEIVPQGKSPYHCVYGRVDYKMPPFRSKIKKAPLFDIDVLHHGVADPRKRIIDGASFDPIVNSLSKMIPAHVPLNYSVIAVISDFMLNFMISKDKLPNYTRSVQSFETCVIGKDCDPYWKGINKNSSSGHPECRNVPSGFKGKQHIFGIYEYDLESIEAKRIKSEFDVAVLNLKNCYRQLFLFIDTAKDECLPLDKVKEGKVRLFAVGALLLLLLNRSYFGDFRAWFLHNRIYNESAIGINVYSMDWHEKVRYLSFGSPDERNYIFIDIKKYDGSMSRVWMYNWYRLMCNWYNDDDNRILRMNLAEHTMNSYHIVNGTIYSLNGVQSSGGANTADLNTGVLGMYFYYACLIVVFGFDSAVFQIDGVILIDTLKSIARDVRMQRFGDDIESCVKTDSVYFGIITESSIIKALKLMGIEATSDTKDDVVHDYRYLSEGSFLKRTSRYDERNSRFVGMLEIKSILKSVQWFRDSDPSLEDYRQTLQKALEELSLHPRETFDKYSSFIIKQGRNRVNFVPITSDYFLLQKLCFRRDDYGLTPQLGVLPQLSIMSVSDVGPEMRLDLTGKEKQENDSKFVLQSQPACSLHSRIGVVTPKNFESIEWRSQSYISLTANTNENNDTNEVTEAMQFNVEDSVSVTMSAADYNAHPSVGTSDDIRQWLSRPFRVFTGVWSTASNLGDNIFTYDLAGYFLSNVMAQSKLRGYKYIKCTHVIKVELSPTPFHAGSFMMQWHPFPQAEKNVSMHRTPICSSQLPNVLVTCAENSAEIRMPWIYPTHGYDFLDPANSYNWGAIIGKVYSPLATGTGATTVSLNMFQWLEEVEIFGLHPQSSGSKNRNSPKGIIPSDGEKNNGEGPITRALGIGVKVADSLGTIPMFAPLCQPASWVLNTASRVSSLFGWSKPSIGEGGKVISTISVGDAYNNNCNGTDNTFVLTPSVDFGLTPTKMMTIRSEDEMSLDFISSHWSYLSNWTFTTSNNANDIVYTQQLNLQFFGNSQSVLSAVPLNYYHVASLTPLAYLANVYKYWRGDLEFKFIFVKTGFHTGQLRFAYYNNLTTLDANSEQYAVRELVDLQTGNEFCMTCPYISNKPYLDCAQGTLGKIEVSMATGLNAPTTVANSVNVLVFVRGAPGFDFQAPIGLVPMPVFAPQGITDDEVGSTGNSDIGGVITKSRANDIMSQWTIGDNSESILAYVKRFSSMSIYYSSFSSTVPPGGGIVFNPQLVEAPIVSAGSGLAITPMAFDNVSRFSWLYLFRRGGVKIRVKNYTKGNTPLVVSYGFGSVLSGWTSMVTPDPFVSRYNFLAEKDYTSQGIEVSQYDDEFGAMQTSDLSAKSRASGLNIALIFPTGVSVNNDYTQDTVSINRAASDDFHYSFFLGIPTVMINTTFYPS